MLWSVIAAAVLGATGLHMIFSGKYATTRRMSWIPFAMAAMELAMCGALDLAAYPVLTAILMVCRLTVLVCCYRVLKIDAAMERTRQRRRAVCHDDDGLIRYAAQVFQQKLFGFRIQGAGGFIQK